MERQLVTHTNPHTVSLSESRNSSSSLLSGRYYSERGDAVAKASKNSHVVSAALTPPCVLPFFNVGL